MSIELARPRPTRKRILLSGVFGPFGVDDAYGRKENIMELFHNQVTKAQGASSWRYHHRSFGLYFLAANLDADVTVLDFPSRKRFLREVRKGYDVVGLSFITPNFLKAREMARLTRRYAPKAVIVLGGHGTAIEGIGVRIDCDHVIRGEGIRGMRSLLGQDPDGPLVHPVLPSVERRSILGVPVPGIGASLLVPGLGCVNGCRFCSTSHFFDRRYHSFLPTGRDLFETARTIADLRGTDEFFVMDENFLKDTDRARELLEEMDRHGRYFRFNIFSSAEAIGAFGLDNLVRLGVGFVWIGVEASGSEGNYPKNEGVDARALVRELRERGVVVLASGILCQEHHTPANIQGDIDFLVGLEADLTQFMLLTPMPVTGLYREQQERHVLRTELPFEEWHGQKHLAYQHPAFPGDSAEWWLTAAFRQDYEENSSSMYRVVETSLRGHRRLADFPRRDACLDLRMRQLREQTRKWSAVLPALARGPVNDQERRRALALDRQIAEALGPPSPGTHLRRAAARVLAARWRLRLRILGDVLQPKTLVTRFRPGAPGVATVPLPCACEPEPAREAAAM
ncbi:MAG: cobalamin B12-binding domain-containing protein [Deltaproteobacteria bacterium]|nr:cobalamin B12-binding domain-containing protein [Deltaproteobacteria bacterium]